MPSPTHLYRETHLSCRNGHSDKVYIIRLHVLAPLAHCTVTAHYGRRGSALAAAVKTPQPVPQDKAEAIIDALLREKVRKGYDVDYDKRLCEPEPEPIPEPGCMSPAEIFRGVFFGCDTPMFAARRRDDGPGATPRRGGEGE